MIIVYGQANRSGVGHAGYSDPEDDLNRAKAWLSVQQVSLEAPQVQQGSLYPALHRLEQQGWIKAHWAETETGRKAKFYSLTRAGRTQMEKEMANWDRLSAAINLVVRTV